MTEPSLKQQAVTAVGWSWLGQTGRQLVTFTVTIALARLLVPEHFGLIAMVLVVSEFAALFAEIGMGAALVQHPEPQRRHENAVFWATLAIGLGLTLATLAAAPLVAWFYDRAELVDLTRAIAPSFALGSLAVVPQALLTRRMEFHRIARVELLAAIVAGACAIAAAACGLGVASLAVQYVVLAAATAAGVWWTSAWRPTGRPEWSAIGELMGFSANLVGYNAVNYWARSADYLLIGKFLGSAALGIYSYAYRIMLIPLSQLTRAMQRVMFPTLSRIQHDPPRVKAIYLRANASIALLTMPIVCGLFVLAKPFVEFALGPDWSGVAPLLQILCLAAIKQPIGATTGWLYQSQGRTDLMLRWSLACGAVTIGGFAIGLAWGTTGVAASYAVTRYLTWYHGIAIPGRLIGMSFREFVGNVAGVFGCAAGMGAAVWALGLCLPALPPGLDLAVRVPFGAAVYLGLVHGCGVAAYRDARSVLFDHAGRVLRRA